jgi:hypothetical protein
MKNLVIVEIKISLFFFFLSNNDGKKKQLTLPPLHSYRGVIEYRFSSGM